MYDDDRKVHLQARKEKNDSALVLGTRSLVCWVDHFTYSFVASARIPSDSDSQLRHRVCVSLLVEARAVA